MVHNGIEYGDMQLICEAYNIMKNGLGMTAPEMHEVFKEWNTGELDSYLIEITRDILAYKDADGAPLVDKILDTAGQKGTGKWTIQNSADLGVPITLIAEAVYARCVSARKRAREGGKKLKGRRTALTSITKSERKKRNSSRHPRGALRLKNRQLRAGLHTDAHGGHGIRLESQLRRHRAHVARRLHHPVAFPRQDQGSLRQDPKLTNLLLDDYFRGEIKRCQKSWRNVVAAAAKRGIPVPAFSTALAFYDQYQFARPAGEPVAGAARLLRRAHLQAN